MDSKSNQTVKDYIYRLKHVSKERYFWNIQLQNLVAVITWFAKVSLVAYGLRGLFYFLTLIGVSLSDSIMMWIGLVLLVSVYVYGAKFVFSMTFKGITRNPTLLKLGNRWLQVVYLYPLLISEGVLSLNLYKDIANWTDIPVTFYLSLLIKLAIVILGSLNWNILWNRISKAVSIEKLQKESETFQPTSAKFIIQDDLVPFIQIKSYTIERSFSDGSNDFQVVKMTYRTSLKYSWLSKTVSIDYPLK